MQQIPFDELRKVKAAVLNGEDVPEAHIIQYMRCFDASIFTKVLNEKKTAWMCEAAVDMDEKNLQFVPDEKKTKQMYHNAVDRNLNYIGLVPKEFMTHAFAYKVCSNHPYYMFHCENIPITKMIVDLLPENLREYTNLHAWGKRIPERLSEICRFYLERDGLVLQWVIDPTLDECRTALHQNPLALQWIPEDKQKELLEEIIDVCAKRQELWKYVAKGVQSHLATYLVHVIGAPSSICEPVQKYVLSYLL